MCFCVQYHTFGRVHCVVGWVVCDCVCVGVSEITKLPLLPPPTSPPPPKPSLSASLVGGKGAIVSRVEPLNWISVRPVLSRGILPVSCGIFSPILHLVFSYFLSRGDFACRSWDF